MKDTTEQELKRRVAEQAKSLVRWGDTADASVNVAQDFGGRRSKYIASVNVGHLDHMHFTECCGSYDSESDALRKLLSRLESRAKPSEVLPFSERFRVTDGDKSYYVIDGCHWDDDGICEFYLAFFGPDFVDALPLIRETMRLRRERVDALHEIEARCGSRGAYVLALGALDSLGLTEYGCTPRLPWLTPDGKAVLDELETIEELSGGGAPARWLYE